MQEDCKYLFTYGTLRDSNVNHKAHYLKESAELVGRGYIHACLYKVSWYPAINLDESKTQKVYGDIFKLPMASYETILHELDGYEGIYDSNEASEEYERVLVEAFLEDGTVVRCWTYNYKKSLEKHTRILSGDYLHYLQKQE